MKPFILLLFAATTIGSAGARPSPHAPSYEAGGFEPNWQVLIGSGLLYFNPGTTQPAFTVRLPRRQPTRRGYRLVVPGLILDVRHEPCSSYDGRDYPDAVYAFFNGSSHDGCGGVSIPPRRLAHYDWSVGFVGRMRLPDEDNISVQFNEGNHFVVQSACDKYEGSYRERRPRLEIMNLRRTWNACSHRVVDPRVVAILRMPMRMHFIDGDNLILTSRAGRLHLVP